MTSPGSASGQTVVIENGRIKSIGPEGSTKIPSGAEVVDGTGKYVIPGLFDMHTHFFYEQGNNVNTCPAELKLMIANGLTTVRISCGDSAYLAARHMVRKGKWPGPEMIVTSPQLVGSWPWMGKVFAGVARTPEQGAALVRKYKKEGYDQIKLTFMVKPDVYDAVVSAGKEEDIAIVGHVGPLVKLPRALAAKQQIEHMDEFLDMLLPDTSFNHGQTVSDMNLWKKQAWATVSHLEENRIPGLVAKVRDAGIYVTPTNHFFESFFGRGIDSLSAIREPSYKYIPPPLKHYAWEVRRHYQKMRADENVRLRYVELRAKIISSLWKAGVPLMAGSDSPQWFGVTGFALHDELENLVRCGLTPYAALQTATVNPARFMKMDRHLGTVAPGKDADLVLLNADPLADIRHTREIAGVFVNGKYFSRSALDRLLTEAGTLAE